ncbi:hypothetical protein M758_3G142100 [Ceratodon purpureus]|nr:hypothetical protein M758_3G142100 [Ceratodon purpureus]
MITRLLHCTILLVMSKYSCLYSALYHKLTIFGANLDFNVFRPSNIHKQSEKQHVMALITFLQIGQEFPLVSLRLKTTKPLGQITFLLYASHCLFVHIPSIFKPFVILRQRGVVLEDDTLELVLFIYPKAPSLEISTF